MYALSGVVSAIRSGRTWPAITNVLIGRYSNEVVLGDAYALVTTVWKRNDETKDELGTSLESYPGVCSGVFNEQLLSDYFLRGCLPTIVKVVGVQVHRLPPRDSVSFSVVGRIVQAICMTY